MRLPPGATEVEITSSALFIKMISEPHLCMLLNPNLTEFQIEEMKNTWHIIQIQHDGDWYNAVVLGYYKPKIPENPEELAEREARIIDFWIS